MISRENLKRRMHELVEKDRIDTEEFASLNLQLVQLNKMLNYVIRGSWGGTRTREAFAFWLRSNYNYELTAQKFKMPVLVVEQLVKEADRVLARKIEKPLQMICAKCNKIM